jgi:hypothetical protein
MGFSFAGSLGHDLGEVGLGFALDIVSGAPAREPSRRGQDILDNMMFFDSGKSHVEALKLVG